MLKDRWESKLAPAAAHPTTSYSLSSPAHDGSPLYRVVGSQPPSVRHYLPPDSETQARRHLSVILWCVNHHGKVPLVQGFYEQSPGRSGKAHREKRQTATMSKQGALHRGKDNPVPGRKVPSLQVLSNQWELNQKL